MNVVYIIRHCEKPADPDDENLSALGQEHARTIGQFFSDRVEPKPAAALSCMPSTLLTKSKVHGHREQGLPNGRGRRGACGIAGVATKEDWIPGAEAEVAGHILKFALPPAPSTGQGCLLQP